MISKKSHPICHIKGVLVAMSLLFSRSRLCREGMRSLSSSIGNVGMAQSSAQSVGFATVGTAAMVAVVFHTCVGLLCIMLATQHA